MLVDAATYFAAARAAMREAHSTIFIVGWDLDSRVRLVGDNGTSDDGLPDALIPFLTALVERRPKLRVFLLVWDYSVLYALERQPFPAMTMGWRTPARIRFCLDDNLPAGAAHHQKIVVVDDSVAFLGGLDLTTRRWDTSSHAFENPLRVDHAGVPYRPFHDVQVAVDGAAARSLAELVRWRWAMGACERPPPLLDAEQGIWPRHVRPDFTGVDVGIARTIPASEDEPGCREVERLFLDSIDAAERAIYIENQYLTSTRFAERLAKRLSEKPQLEALIVVPKGHDSWLESLTMQRGRIRFMHTLEGAGVSDRVRLAFPQVASAGSVTQTMVHSKLMIVDDVLLHVGSANLNNRSAGLDTECDLALEARDERQRAIIRHLRDRLVAHHCGVTAEDVRQELARTGSLLAVAQNRSAHGHSLQPVDDILPGHPWPALESIADPEQPIPAPALLSEFVGPRPPVRRLERFARPIAVAVMIIILIFAWYLTPLASLTDPKTVHATMSAIADMPASWAVVPALFVIAGLVAFPVTLLIAATAAVFGPLLGFAYAGSGALISAVVTYGIGVLIGRRALQDVIGPRLNRIRRAVAKRGVIAVATVRLVPLAPFTVINLAAGASHIRFQDFLVGTALGLLPGLVLMSAMGHQILSVITQPTATNVLMFVAAVLAWVALSIGAQAIVMRTRKS